MKRSVQDKMAAFIAERGDDGVTSSELADVFLHPASAAPELCRRLIRNVLAGDPRVCERPDGRWVAQKSIATPVETADYVVLEAIEAAAKSGRFLVEWAAVHVDRQGRTGGTAGSGIRPDPWPAGLMAPAHLRGTFTQAPLASEAAAQAAAFARGATIVSLRTGSFQSAVARILASAGTPAPFLSLLKLGRQLFKSGVRTTEALAARLDVPAREPTTASDAAAFTAELLSALLAKTEELGGDDPDSWLERQHPRRLGRDFSGYEFDRGFLDTLPESPGIYIMRDGNGEAVYVGKAVNLRERVKSYFRARVSRDEKTEKILDAVSSIDIEEKGSELEALLMEYRTIQKLQPRINVQYDVHERLVPKDTPHRRLVVVLPSAGPDTAEIFLLRGNEALNHIRVNRSDVSKLRNRADDFFQARTGPNDAVSSTEELGIVWSWLGRNEDGVNMIDVDMAGGIDEVMRLIEKYLGEDDSGKRVFHV